MSIKLKPIVRDLPNNGANKHEFSHMNIAIGLSVYECIATSVLQYKVRPRYKDEENIHKFCLIKQLLVPCIPSTLL